MLQAAAAQPGAHAVPSLYALAVIDAEGGHYEQVRVVWVCAWVGLRCVCRRSSGFRL